jgi:hypothetical protein
VLKFPPCFIDSVVGHKPREVGYIIQPWCFAIGFPGVDVYYQWSCLLNSPESGAKQPGGQDSKIKATRNRDIHSQSKNCHGKFNDIAILTLLSNIFCRWSIGIQWCFWYTIKVTPDRKNAGIVFEAMSL